MSADEATDLTALVAPKKLRRLAGERSFGRGETYFLEGAVRSLRGRGGGIEAMVQGTRTYRVRLWPEDGTLEHDCTCPIGREGDFCKHCVAVGLTWHAGETGGETGKTADRTPVAEEDFRGYLAGLEKEELVSLLLDRAFEDERLHRRLAVRAAAASRATPDLPALKQAFDGALRADGFAPYREVHDYASGIEEMIDTLEGLLQAGEARSVIELSEHGVESLEEGLEYAEDSEGEWEGLLQRLQELHLEACRRERPDPSDLAERLFELELDSSYGAFHRAVHVYADVLGETGQATYRRLAEAEWARVPALTPGNDDSMRYGGRYQITAIMEGIARTFADLDALVAVKSRDLSSQHAFLEIAQLHRDAGNRDLALDWAERGRRAFPDQSLDPRLRAFITDAYHRGGRHDEAIALDWEAFGEHPSLETYRRLEQHARPAGQWSDWRERALSLVRERIADEPARPTDRPTWMFHSFRDHSLLVEIFLHEGDPDGAWREAEAGGCTQELWLTLAERRERSHPDEAVKVYKDHIASLLRDTGDRVYQEAVRTLERIEKVLARAGRKTGFQDYLTELRATQKRKRNLMKMLDRKGW